MAPVETVSSAPSGRPLTEATPLEEAQLAPPARSMARAGVMMPLFSRADSTQRAPDPVTWPNRMHIGLPMVQPSIEMISVTIEEMSGVADDGVAESVARVPGGEAAHLLPGHPGVAEGAVVLVLLVVDHLGDDLPAHHARVAARARSAVEVDGLATGDVVAGVASAGHAVVGQQGKQVIDVDGVGLRSARQITGERNPDVGARDSDVGARCFRGLDRGCTGDEHDGGAAGGKTLGSGVRWERTSPPMEAIVQVRSLLDCADAPPRRAKHAASFIIAVSLPSSVCWLRSPGRGGPAERWRSEARAGGERGPNTQPPTADRRSSINAA
jgi:hypothetical protein